MAESRKENKASLSTTLDGISQGIDIPICSNIQELSGTKSATSRARILLRRAEIYAKIPRQELAFRDLKEAVSLAPEDQDIIEAIHNFSKLNIGVSDIDPRPILKLFLGGDKEAGKRLVDGVASDDFAAKLLEGDGLSQLLEHGIDVDKGLTGEILLKLSLRDSKLLLARVIHYVSLRLPETVLSFLTYNSHGVEAITTICLQNWEDESLRRQTIQILFNDLSQRLSRSVTDAEIIVLLNAFIRLCQSETVSFYPDAQQIFPSFLPLLSQPSSQAVQARSTLLLSILVGKAKEDSNLISSLKHQICDFLSSRLSRSTPSDYICTFAVLSSVFALMPQVGAQMFRQDGFLEEGLDGVSELDDPSTTKAFLELLSAACVDRGCRESMPGVVGDFLQDCSANGDPEIRALSTSVHAKLISSTAARPNYAELLKIFKEAYASKNEKAMLSAVEGLTFSSVVPATKESLSKDSSFLSILLAILRSPGCTHPLIYGCLSILVNLTAYAPSLTEDEKRINDIRRFANETDVPHNDVLEDDSHVAARCKAVLDAGFVTTINNLASTYSPASIGAVAQIILSVSRAPPNRGLLVQQGTVKLTLLLLSRQVDRPTELALAQTLSRVLTSVNPALIFSSRTPITAPIEPLTKILAFDSLPNELPRFESLRALTNLSSADDSARTLIVEKAWTVTETLLLSNLPLLQQAATELICNLVVCQKGAEKFFSDAGGASRLHLLLVLADVEDVATRRAASGALAMLTSMHPHEMCKPLCEVERGVERVCRMLDDEDDGVKHRGKVCLGNLMEFGSGDVLDRASACGIFSGDLAKVDQ